MSALKIIHQDPQKSKYAARVQAKEWETYKPLVEELFKRGLEHRDMLARLNKAYNTDISMGQFSRQLVGWDLRRYRPRQNTMDSEGGSSIEQGCDDEQAAEANTVASAADGLPIGDDLCGMQSGYASCEHPQSVDNDEQMGDMSESLGMRGSEVENGEDEFIDGLKRISSSSPTSWYSADEMSLSATATSQSTERTEYDGASIDLQLYQLDTNEGGVFQNVSTLRSSLELLVREYRPRYSFTLASATNGNGSSIHGSVPEAPLRVLIAYFCSIKAYEQAFEAFYVLAKESCQLADVETEVRLLFACSGVALYHTTARQTAFAKELLQLVYTALRKDGSTLQMHLIDYFLRLASLCIGADSPCSKWFPQQAADTHFAIAKLSDQISSGLSWTNNSAFEFRLRRLSEHMVKGCQTFKAALFKLWSLCQSWSERRSLSFRAEDLAAWKAWRSKTPESLGSRLEALQEIFAQIYRDSLPDVLSSCENPTCSSGTFCPLYGTEIGCAILATLCSLGATSWTLSFTNWPRPTVNLGIFLSRLVFDDRSKTITWENPNESNSKDVSCTTEDFAQAVLETIAPTTGFLPDRNLWNRTEVEPTTTIFGIVVKKENSNSPASVLSGSSISLSLRSMRRLSARAGNMVQRVKQGVFSRSSLSIDSVKSQDSQTLSAYFPYTESFSLPEEDEDEIMADD